MHHLTTKYAPDERVAAVVRRTGCTEQQAVNELIAEEGGVDDAVRNLNGMARTTGDDPRLLPRADWQTQARGTNDAEYEIYRTNAESLGWRVKSYDEWLNS
ncbi:MULTISPECIES: hypothetical protein [Burkholderiaceae]|uniref:Uncharacterized protein n=2 Tax=Burkholderiaceae TaxID=119060 RepID=A0A5E5P1K6_9BURK|nr:MULTISPECIES: hypothetical protein [Burkholderiaceae]AOZ05928.1 hypothetical protein BKK80_08895 [Cupriavidus malaysiensis]MCA8206275.1 hypothetical protein [Burkholderia vietnamiensis]VVG70458.1 hypothetical protein PAP18089_01418 [Pandoraea apista]HDR8943073.1 hypothetical protein [Burkholderia vietnamiensis]HDR9205323.1 hypothetical protein [Burkholderia vietnamiensis]